MSIALALLAGALATLNPCAFAMLPAFLALYVGTHEDELPRASTRTLQGIFVGLIVSAGFLSVFLALGLPVVLGAAQISGAVPWLGLAIGLALGVVAVLTLAGKSVSVSVSTGVRRPLVDGSERRPRAMLLFGVGYGLASLGCTMPIFLMVLGTSLSTGGPLVSMVVFGAYAFGMAIVLMALAIGAAMLRDGVVRALRRVLPHLRWITGGLLLLAGAYLTYYWGSALLVSADARASDPIVRTVDTATSMVTRVVGAGGGRWMLMGAVTIVAIALIAGLWQWVSKPIDSHEVSAER